MSISRSAIGLLAGTIIGAGTFSAPAVAAVFPNSPTYDTVRQVSVTPTGDQPPFLSSSQAPAMSATGRFIAFDTDVSGLVPDDTNRFKDVIVKDMQTNTYDLVSVDSEGRQWSRAATAPAISADGRYVTFKAGSDAYLRDRVAGTTELIQTQTTGRADVSDDGRYVAFATATPNLVPADTDTNMDVFVHDRITRTVRRASEGPAGQHPRDSHVLDYWEMSGDGRFVVFSSTYSGLGVTDTNGLEDVYLKDMTTGAMSIQSGSAFGLQADGAVTAPRISSDGRWIAFRTRATSMTPSTPNADRRAHIYLRRVDNPSTTYQISPRGLPVGDLDTYARPLGINRDGRTVLFTENSADGYYVWNTDQQRAVQANVEVGEYSALTSLTGDGLSLAFQTARAIVPQDTNMGMDIYLLSRDTEAPDTLITDTAPINHDSYRFDFSSSEDDTGYQCRMDTAAWTSCAPAVIRTGMTFGEHRFSVRAIDSIGNADPTPAQASVTITAEPQINPLLPPVLSDDGTAVRVGEGMTVYEGSWEGEQPITFSIQWERSDPIVPGSFHSIDGATDRTYQVTAHDLGRTLRARVTAYNSAGSGSEVSNVSPEVRPALGPISLTGVAAGALINDKTPTISFASPDSAAVFECSVDRRPFVSCTSPFTMDALADGEHEFTVRAVGGGDTTEATRAFDVDTVAPAVVKIDGPSGRTGDRSPEVVFSVSDPSAQVDCRVDEGPWFACSSPWRAGNGDGSELANGEHSAQVRAIDPAGNSSEASWTFVVAVSRPVGANADEGNVVGRVGEELSVAVSDPTVMTLTHSDEGASSAVIDVTSTLPAWTLSIRDTRSDGAGHMRNGTTSLQQPLRYGLAGNRGNITASEQAVRTGAALEHGIELELEQALDANENVYEGEVYGLTAVLSVTAP